jgi:hypothetical protein
MISELGQATDRLKGIMILSVTSYCLQVNVALWQGSAWLSHTMSLWASLQQTEMLNSLRGMRNAEDERPSRTRDAKPMLDQELP